MSAVPTNTTARQSMSLDFQRASAEASTTKNEDRLARKIKIEINRSWLEVMVNASSSRQTLALPLCDLIDKVSHHGHAHSETIGSDAEDTDHGVFATLHLEQPRMDLLHSP